MREVRPARTVTVFGLGEAGSRIAADLAQHVRDAVDPAPVDTPRRVPGRGLRTPRLASGPGAAGYVALLDDLDVPATVTRSVVDALAELHQGVVAPARFAEAPPA